MVSQKRFSQFRGKIALNHGKRLRNAQPFVPRRESTPKAVTGASNGPFEAPVTALGVDSYSSTNGRALLKRFPAAVCRTGSGPSVEPSYTVLEYTKFEAAEIRQFSRFLFFYFIWLFSVSG